MFTWRRRAQQAHGPRNLEASQSPCQLESSQPCKETTAAYVGRYLSDVQTVVVIGAHNGHTSVQYARDFPRAQVHSFEPDPRSYLELEANVEQSQLAERIHTYPMAIADTVGEVHLNRFSHTATSSLFPAGRMHLWDGPVDEIEPVIVPVSTLDQWASASRIPRIDILHMDIQGAELLALRGGEDLLRGGRTALIRSEVEFEELYAEQPLVWDVGGLLSEYGYRLLTFCDVVVRPTSPPTVAWADALWVPR